MDDDLWLEIPIAPIPKGRPRASGGRVHTPSRTRDYELAVGWELRKAFATPKASAVSVELQFVIKSASADLDNLAKAILDAGNGIAWEDDRQVCELHAWKRTPASGENERTLFRITELGAAMRIEEGE